jgi:integrase
VNNPFGEGENKVELKKVKPGKTRFLSPAEEARLCQHVGSTHAPWVRLAILTGLRRHEQFNLRWSNIDLDQGQLVLPSTKAGEVQYVMLTDEGRAILRAMLTTHMEKGRVGDYVFPSPGNPTRHLDEDNFCGRVFLPAV